MSSRDPHAALFGWGAMAIMQGDLAEYPVPDLLQFLQGTRKHWLRSRDTHHELARRSPHPAPLRSDPVLPLLAHRVRILAYSASNVFALRDVSATRTAGSPRIVASGPYRP